jgi:quinol monooxygenase YgiN
VITYITHLRIAGENAAEFEDILAEMMRNVAAHEPGVIHYALSKSVDDPELYVVIEVYRDEAAFKAHWQTDFIRPSLARTRPLVREGSMDIKRYETPSP